MDYEQICHVLDDQLAGIAFSISELTNAIKEADRGRNDALCAVGSIKAAIQAQDVEIQGLTNRLEANEQAVQSCLSTLGELNKMIQVIASKIPA